LRRLPLGVARHLLEADLDRFADVVVPIVNIGRLIPWLLVLLPILERVGLVHGCACRQQHVLLLPLLLLAVALQITHACDGQLRRAEIVYVTPSVEQSDVVDPDVEEVRQL